MAAQINDAAAHPARRRLPPNTPPAPPMIDLSSPTEPMSPPRARPEPPPRDARKSADEQRLLPDYEYA